VLKELSKVELRYDAVMTTVRDWFGDRFTSNRPPNGHVDQARSKRSRFMTLSHAATKSRTNFSFESSHA
jgi:hypothetical protein